MLKRRLALLLAAGALAGLPAATSAQPASSHLAVSAGTCFTSCVTTRAAPSAFSSAAASIYEDYSKVGYLRRSYGGRWNIYEDYSKVGYAKRSYGGRWDLYAGYSKVGYTSRTYGNTWNVYADYSKVGYVRRSYGSTWNAYADYSKIGYARGSGGNIGAAALLLVIGTY
jgi:hypothetical protein